MLKFVTKPIEAAEDRKSPLRFKVNYDINEMQKISRKEHEPEIYGKMEPENENNPLGKIMGENFIDSYKKGKLHLNSAIVPKNNIIPSVNYVNIQKAEKSVKPEFNLKYGSIKKFNTNINFKVATGQALNANERDFISDYGFENVISDDFTKFDILAPNNSKVKSFQKQAEEILKKQQNGNKLTENEINVLETFKILNNYRKSAGKSLVKLTPDVNENIRKAETSKAIMQYDNIAYKNDSFTLAGKTIQYKDKNKLNSIDAKIMNFGKDMKFYMESGINNYISGTNTTTDVISGKSVEQIASQPNSSYAIANQMLSQKFSVSGQKGKKLFQDTATSFGEMLVPLTVTTVMSGLGAPTAAVSITGAGLGAISGFGNNYKQGIDLGVKDDKKLLTYALVKTGAETAFSAAFNYIPGAGGMATGRIIEKAVEPISSAVLKGTAKTVLNAGIEFAEQSAQSLITPYLQKYILGADVEVLGDNPKRQLSTAAYNGFVGMTTALISGGISNTVNDSSAQAKAGKGFKAALNKNGGKVTDTAQYITEVFDKNSTAGRVAATVLDGDTSDITVGKMITAAQTETVKSNLRYYQYIGESIQTKTSGVKKLITSYEDNVSKGMIYPPETEKLYKFIKADTERGIAISNGNIGKFAVELELYAPRAAIMGEMIKKLSSDNLSVDSNGVKGYDDKESIEKQASSKAKNSNNTYVIKNKKFLNLDGNVDWDLWAPNGGRIPNTIRKNQRLEIGTQIDRYGNQYGKYVSPLGTPYNKRALPYIETTVPYHKYIVVKPIDNVIVSEIAPAFEQSGGGIQYELPYTISWLKENEFLKELY